jgi:Beta-propeller repeat/Cep192 domain 4/HYDIN/CFA65/VesB-like, Ig-like domain
MGIPGGAMATCRRKGIVLITLFAIAALAITPFVRAQQAGIHQSGGETAQVAVPMVSESWNSTLAGAAPGRQKRQTRFIGHYPGFSAAKKAANHRVTGRTGGQAQSTTTQTLSLAPQAPSVSTVVFDGPSESDTPYIPPDSQIAAGPTYVVAVINSLMAIFDKTGAQQGGFQQLSPFFSSLGVAGEIFDPRIIYDQTDNRFILSAAEVDMANLTNGHMLVAVSQTSDPRGVWNKFAINFMGRNLSNTANTFPDFPALGLSSSAVYITTNQFQLTQDCLSTDSEGCRFSDAWIAVISLPQLLSSTPPSTLTITTFKGITNGSGRLAFTIQPALTYGTPGSEFLVGADFSANPSSGLNVFAIPTSGTLTLSKADLTVPSFSTPPNAVQGGSSALIDTNDFRLLNAVWANGSLWCGQNVADSQAGGVGARWYEIALSDLTSIILSQSGTVSGSGEAYFPALSIKADGTLAMAFSTSSSSLPASAAFTGREPGDAAGTMRGFTIYRQGLGPYDELVGNRWGDCSGSSEDPDGNSIWMIAEFSGTPDPHFGTGIAQVAGAPTITATPSNLDFGSGLVGQTSPSRVVTVTNVSTDASSIGQITLAGPYAGSFSIVSDACSNTSLAAGQYCQVSLTFSPSDQTSGIVAYLSIPSGTSGITTVGLIGRGVVTGVLSITPLSLTFPATVQQGASAPQVVSISNTGNATATIINLTINGDFAETNNCGSSLAPGGTCQLNITFRPTAAGTFEGYLNFLSNTQAQFYTISFSGVGITAPAALFCPDSLNFGNQVTNTTSNSHTIVLTNSGSDQLTVTGTSVSGDFSLTSNCPGSMAPHSTCTLNVIFTPTSIGTLNGALLVYDNAQGSPQSIPLTGTGVSSTAQRMLPGDGFEEMKSGSDLHGAHPEASGRLAFAGPEAEFKTLTSSGSNRHKLQGKESYPRLPLSFEANNGQTSSQAKFLSRGAGYAMFLMARGAILKLEGRRAVPRDTESAGGNQQSKHQPSLDATVLQMGLPGANSNPEVMGLGKLPGKANYFIGNDPSKWLTNVPLYARVKYRDIYPGVDLVYYGNQRQLEYDFVVAPGADPGKIRFSFSGESQIRLDHTGNLILTIPAGRVSFHKPRVYQRNTGAALTGRALPKGQGKIRTRLSGGYVLLSSNQVAFRLGPYDHRKPLVIDPMLSFSTYLGGSGGDAANAIAVDSSGNAYIAGKTESVDFPLSSGAFQTTCGKQGYPCSYPFNYNAFVAKLSSDGSKLLYATYLGGSSSTATEANGIAVDSSGNAYVAGSTYSNDFPTTSGSFQPQPMGTLQDSDRSSGFVTKLNSTGSSLVYSTYLAGTPEASTVPVLPADSAKGISLDTAGEAIVVGTTSESDFPTTPGAFQTTGPTSGDVIGFVTKLNAAGSGLVFSTFLGGTSNDELNAVALDSSGNVYVAGTANSLDFPTTPGAFQTGSYSYVGSNTSPGASGVLAKFTASGNIVYSTYIGSGASSVAAGPTGEAYVTGRASESFPATPNALSTTYNLYAAFLAKLHPAGCALLYGSFLNPPAFGASENVQAIALDSSGDIYLAGGVTGALAVPSFGVNALQPSLQISPGFISELDSTGTQLLFSSPVGGSGQFGNSNFGEEVRGMAVDAGGDIYVAGRTYSQDLPIANAFEAVPPGQNTNGTGFVEKLSPGQTTGVTLTRSSLSFYPLPVGYNGNAQIQAVGLQNHQATPLNISSVVISGNGFSKANISPLPPSCTGSIAANTGCGVLIQFVPTAIGPATGSVTINDDGPGSPRIVQLNGDGIADFALELGASSGVAGGQAQYTIYASPVYGAPVGSDTSNIDLSCVGVAPATCSFSNSPIAVNGAVPNNSTLTVGNLSAVSSTSLSFSVVGTLGTQTYSLPITTSLIPPDFTIGLASGQSSSETVTAGGSATYNISISPQRGFNQAVTFSCSGAPTRAACSVSPNPVTLDGSNNMTATVTVTTTARSVAPGAYRVDGPRWFGVNGRQLQLALLLLLATLMMVIAASGRPMASMDRNHRSLLRVSAIILLVLLCATCGGGGSVSRGGGGGPSQQTGTPAGTYTLTLTGTSGNLNRSTTLKLTVQ